MILSIPLFPLPLLFPPHLSDKDLFHQQCLSSEFNSAYVYTCVCVFWGVKSRVLYMLSVSYNTKEDSQFLKLVYYYYTIILLLLPLPHYYTTITLLLYYYYYAATTITKYQSAVTCRPQPRKGLPVWIIQKTQLYPFFFLSLVYV